MRKPRTINRDPQFLKFPTCFLDFSYGLVELYTVFDMFSSLPETLVKNLVERRKKLRLSPPQSAISYPTSPPYLGGGFSYVPRCILDFLSFIGFFLA